MRAARSRARTDRNTDNLESVRWHYEALQRDYAQLRADLSRVIEQREEMVKERAKLERLVAKRDAYISGQAEKIAAARDRSTRLLIERDEAISNRPTGTVDHTKYEQTRQFLEEGRTAYRTLRRQYDELAAGLDSAVRERESLKEVVRSWDTLCQRLHKQTNGTPRNAKDQETLALWRDFRAHMKRQNNAAESGAR